MKRIIVLVLAIAPVCAIAAEPSTSCPSGYVAVVEEHMDIANNSCTSGYTSAGLVYRIQMPPAHMNLNRRVPWNRGQVLAAHARGIIYPHPPSCFARHPPPTEPPTQTMFARGPVVAVGIRVWYRSGILFSIIVTTPSRKARHPSAEGNFVPRRDEAEFLFT